MSKIAFDNKKGKFTIVNKLTYPENVNERVYNAIISGVFPGFLPLSIKQKRKEIHLECVVEGLVPMNQYFNCVVTKKMFLDFVYQIILHIKNCDKNMINANNLDLNSERIFVEPQTKAVKCIFWPVVNNQCENPPQLFLKQLPYRMNFSPYENNDYINIYNGFFNNVNPFSVNSFERMIMKLQGRPANIGRSAPSSSLSSNLSHENKGDKMANEAKKVAVEYNPFSNNDVQAPVGTVSASTNDPANNTNTGSSVCYCKACGAMNSTKAKFCKKCGKPINVKKPSVPEMPQSAPVAPVAPQNIQNIPEMPQSAPVAPVATQNIQNIPEMPQSAPVAPVAPQNIPDIPQYAPNPQQSVGVGALPIGDEGDGTTVLGYDKPKAPILPALVKERTKEIIIINKPVFKIGTEQIICDLCITDNNYISRSHADIITKNQRYFIVDKKSTNKTFVDGKVILPEQETEIFSGSKIRLANENFIFVEDSTTIKN